MLRRPGQPPRRPGGLPSPGGRKQSESRYQKLVFDGDRFFNEKDYETAFKIFKQALPEAPPGEAYALSQLCRCYRKKARKAFKKANHEQVVALLEEMMALEKVKPHLKGLDYQVLAESCLESGRLERAEEAIRYALDLKPELAEDIHRLQKKLKAEQLHRQMKGLH